MQERLNNLPQTARLGVLGAVVFAVLLIIYFTTLRGDGLYVAKEVPTESDATGYVDRLETAGVNGAEIRRAGTEWEVVVPVANRAKAQQAVSASFIPDYAASCVKYEQGMMPDKNKAKAKEECEKTAQVRTTVHESLADKGVMSVGAQVTRTAGDGFGEEAEWRANITLNMPSEHDTINGASLAGNVANILGGTSAMANIVILDGAEVIYGSGASTATGESSGTASGAFCSPDDFDNIHTAQACLQNKYRADMLAAAQAIVGDAERVDVYVTIDLDSTTSNTTISKAVPGPKASEVENSSSAGGTSNSNRDTSYANGQEVETIDKQAGDVSRINVTAVLRGGTGSEAAALTRQLNVLAAGIAEDHDVDVRSVAKSDSASDAASDDAAASMDTSSSDSSVDAMTESMPKGMAVAGFVLLVVLITALALLWRRSSRLAAERRLFEEEFRNDMQRFQHVASDSPDLLADQIGDWIRQQPMPGAPSIN